MHLSNRMVVVGDHRMAYRECGSGSPIVFLHGNPTSSFLWRNVMPPLGHLGRCIAPDLIGMGASDKLHEDDPDRYRFVSHRRFLDGFMETFHFEEPVLLVVHDWGGVLGFDWARRHREAVRGICYMETFVRPATWDEYPPHIREIFQRLRNEDGVKLCLEENFFVERMLPQGTIRSLTREEMDAYRAPFRRPGEDRLPTLTWAREVPIDGGPADVHEIVSAYGDWLSSDARIPKLLIRGEPGQVLARESQIEFCRQWPNQTEHSVPGKHFLQEDSPAEIASWLADWLKTM